MKCLMLGTVEEKENINGKTETAGSRYAYGMAVHHIRKSHIHLLSL
jgi:hypothetical protein